MAGTKRSVAVIVLLIQAVTGQRAILVATETQTVSHLVGLRESSSRIARSPGPPDTNKKVKEFE